MIGAVLAHYRIAGAGRQGRGHRWHQIESGARPWRVYQYESSEATTIPSSGTGVSRGGFHFAAAFSPVNEAR
jgi:hypothetical protein